MIETVCKISVSYWANIHSPLGCIIFSCSIYFSLPSELFDGSRAPSWSSAVLTHLSMPRNITMVVLLQRFMHSNPTSDPNVAILSIPTFHMIPYHRNTKPTPSLKFNWIGLLPIQLNLFLTTHIKYSLSAC